MGYTQGEAISSQPYKLMQIYRRSDPNNLQSLFYD